ncbi:MAG TPA: hypothetical protein VHG33_01830 [Woeseiaceae bacterium]|nr:hypothetical protein [Woeseiaceae bacterium]
MANLAAIFSGTAEKSQDSEKLLHLYWNRAELKKEFASMRKEQYRLRDKIKQQEGATARLQQKLDHLEELLLDANWAANVIVFYQLRSLALRCQRKLAKFAEQLKQQREQRQHNGLLVKWNEERSRQMRSIEQQIAEQGKHILQLEADVQSEKDRLIAMSGFMRIFKRRSVTATLDRLAQQVEENRQAKQALSDRLDTIRNAKPPENQGLDLATKRSINLLILAFAQQLYLDFDDSEMAALAKEACDKSVGAIKYGSRQDCSQMLARIQKRSEAMDESGDVADLLQQRAQRIGKKALFRSDGDAVPVAGTVTTVFDFDENGSVRESEANLLGENYWGIAKILSR